MTHILKIEKDHWGFFSNSTVRLFEIINYYNHHNTLPLVDSSEQWKLYKDSEDGDNDISNNFYKEYNEIENINISKYELELINFQIYAYRTMDFNILNEYTKRYFILSDEIISIKNEILNKYNIITSETISICLRGNDKVMELDIPPFENMYNKLLEIKDKYPNHRILVQSDEIDFYEYIQSRIPNIITINEVVKIRHNEKLSVRDFIKDGDRKKQAKLFLAIMSIIADTKHIITNTGNVGLWLCLLRGGTNNVSQEYGNKWLD